MHIHKGSIVLTSTADTSKEIIIMQFGKKNAASEITAFKIFSKLSFYYNFCLLLCKLTYSFNGIKKAFVSLKFLMAIWHHLSK